MKIKYYRMLCFALCALSGQAQAAAAEDLTAQLTEAGTSQSVIQAQVREYELQARLVQMSDYAFFDRLQRECSEALESCLKEADDGNMRDYDDVCAEFRKALQKMLAGARTFYDAQLAFAKESVGENPERDRVLTAVRAQLRSHLVRDLQILSRRGCSWLPWSEQEPELPKSVVAEQIGSLGRSTVDYGHAFSRAVDLRMTLYMRECAAIVSSMRELAGEYEIVSGCWEGDAPIPQKPAEKEFLAAEQAWLDYLECLCEAHTPVMNSYFSGTGTGNFILSARMDFVGSHELYLAELLKADWIRLEPFVDEVASASAAPVRLLPAGN
jgi:hypothetical protein